MILQIPPLHVISAHFARNGNYFMGPRSGNAVWSLPDDKALSAENRYISLNNTQTASGDYSQPTYRTDGVGLILAEFYEFCMEYNSSKPLHKHLGKPNQKTS